MYRVLLLSLFAIGANAGTLAPRNVNTAVQFVGSKTCAACHTQLYEDFKRTSMGQSFGAVAQELKNTLPASAEVSGKSPGRTYQVHWEGAALVQSETFADENGQQVNGPRLPASYRVGSGTNGYTFLVRRDQWLFEAPLSYYSRTKSWDLSPGFDAYDAGFARPVRPACLECHVGRFAAGVERASSFPEEAFAEQAIGCENCHGPGALHVHERGAAKVPASPDDSIANPAQLPPRLANDICLRCHQGNDARVLQPGKTLQADFHPGARLDDTLAIFKLPRSHDQDAAQSDLLEHGFAMMLSQCYRSTDSSTSKGKSPLTCLSCHSVHNTPRPAEKGAYYRARCLACHTVASCRLDLVKRQPDDCVSCHMPKRAVPTIAHTALTNHRILRTADEPFPDVAYQPSADTPGLIHVSALSGPATEKVPDIVLLQAYRALTAQAPPLRTRYLALLDRLKLEQPENPVVLAAWGHELLLNGPSPGSEQAVSLLRKAVDLSHGEDSGVSLDFSEALAKARHFDEAIRVLKQALSRDPYEPKLHKTLIDVTMKTGSFPDAANAMRTYLALFPDDTTVRSLLTEVQASGISR